MTIKRYIPYWHASCMIPAIDQNEGEWVKYEDHEEDRKLRMVMLAKAEVMIRALTGVNPRAHDEQAKKWLSSLKELEHDKK